MAKPTRRQRAQAKKTTPTKAKVTQRPAAAEAMLEAPVTYKLPNVWKLTSQATAILWQHKQLFAGIVAIYGLLNIIFVTGLGGSIDVASVRDDFGSRIVGGLAAYTQLVGSTGASSDQSASVYQMVLFLVVSLALVWALRQAYAQGKFKIRDAYYRGMYPLVPCVVVIVVIALQLLPLIIGGSIYQTVIANGIAASPIEVAMWTLAVLALCLLSMYFIAASLQAFYIATLPDMTPLTALRSARQLVKGRRWLVLRKVLFLPLALLLVMGVILLPVIVIVPILAQLVMLVIGPVLLAIGHSYFYTLYRELMHD